MHTITEAASELNVSRKKIYNHIFKLGIVTIKDSKGNYIKDDDFELLKADVLKDVRERAEHIVERDRDMLGNNISDREYTDLKERIRFLQDQLIIKDKQIQDKDYQLNGLIQTNINFTKLLDHPKYIDVSKKPSIFKKIFNRINKDNK